MSDIPETVAAMRQRCEQMRLAHRAEINTQGQSVYIVPDDADPTEGRAELTQSEVETLARATGGEAMPVASARALIGVKRIFGGRVKWARKVRR